MSQASITEKTAQSEKTEARPYADLWIRGLAAVLDALVFMALSIPVAFIMPLFITRIDASIVLPEIPSFFFLEGFAPCVAFPFFCMTVKQHLEFAAVIGPTESTTLIWCLTMGALVFTNMFYHVIMESSPMQATIGKFVIGMKVTNLEGGRASFFAVLIRHFARLLSMLPAFGGYLLVLKTAKKQALHDKLSGCLVIKENPPG